MRFTKNWNNKLECKYFTTIRKYSNDKFDYYSKKLDKIDDIYIGKAIYRSAKLIKIDVRKLSQVDDILKILDTGTLLYPLIFEKFGLKDDDKVMILLYEN